MSRIDNVSFRIVNTSQNARKGTGSARVNRTTFGVRLASTGQWFTTAAPEAGHALYHPGRGLDDGARDIGESSVLELGSAPAVTTGILHRFAGTGQVGAGVAEAPLACFTEALADLGRRLAVDS